MAPTRSGSSRILLVLVSSVPLLLIETLRRQLDITQVTDVEFWRGVAKQTRREAERKTSRFRQVIPTLARNYDQLADAAEKKAAQ